MLVVMAASVHAQQYDLLLKGGHVIDPRNNLTRGPRRGDSRRAASWRWPSKIDPARRFKTIDVAGLYVTPGLIDLHVHVFTGTGERRSYAGDLSVYPDGFTFRSGVTTAVDAGLRGVAEFRGVQSHGHRPRQDARFWRCSTSWVTGCGAASSKTISTTWRSRRRPKWRWLTRALIVGIKTAHYAGPEFIPVERAVEAGTKADIPVMVDFGQAYHDRSLGDLLARKLRPGDIYTHVYSGLRGELDSATGHANQALTLGRRRGVLFDVGHGGGSFAWRVAVPIVGEGFLPDTISTDLHVGSMNNGMKDMLNVMSKFLALGLSIDEVIERSTWNSARAIKQEQLGHLSVGCDRRYRRAARRERGFRFPRYLQRSLKGTQRLACEMTLRDGKIVYDLNGLGRPDWTTLPKDYRETGDPRWDGTSPPRPAVSSSVVADVLLRSANSTTRRIRPCTTLRSIAALCSPRWPACPACGCCCPRSSAVAQ